MVNNDEPIFLNAKIIAVAPPWEVKFSNSEQSYYK